MVECFDEQWSSMEMFSSLKFEQWQSEKHENLN